MKGVGFFFFFKSPTSGLWGWGWSDGLATFSMLTMQRKWHEAKVTERHGDDYDHHCKVDETLHYLGVDAGGHRLRGGTESVSLGCHDSVQKRMPVLDLSDPLVQAVAFKMIFPTFIIWSSTFPGIKTLTARGQPLPCISFFMRQLFLLLHEI